MIAGSNNENIFIASSFFEDRQVLTMKHLFGIGQGYKPYPTNMRKRV
jgi:hypothetical protein